MSEEKDLEVMIETVVHAERDEIDQAHGRHIIAVTEGAAQRRAERDLTFLDALTRARLASQPTEPGDDAA